MEQLATTSVVKTALGQKEDKCDPERQETKGSRVPGLSSGCSASVSSLVCVASKNTQAAASQLTVNTNLRCEKQQRQPLILTCFTHSNHRFFLWWHCSA